MAPLKEAYRAALPRPIIWSDVLEHCSAALFRSILPLALVQGALSQLSSGSTVPRHSCKALFHTAYLLRLRNDAQVGFGGLPSAGILFLGFFVRNVAADDDVIARLPVRWRGNFVLCRELNRVDDAQDFVEVATGAHRIAELQLDFLVGAYDKNGAHSSIVGGGPAFRRASTLGWQHAVHLGNFELGIADHRVVYFCALRLFDVGCPLLVVRHGIDTQTDDLDVALGKFRLQARHGAELGSADGCEVFGMREQDGPAVADPVVKLNCALRGFSGEIGGGIVDSRNAVSFG